MTPGEATTLLGYLTGASVLVWAARQKGFATEGMAWVALTGFVFAVLGARITEALFEGALSSAFDPRSGGRSLLGGLLAGWAGVEIAKRRLGIRSSTGDLFALALPAGEAVGRVGCYLNGCCYGTEFQGAWAVWQHGAWRHPAQIYAALASLGLLLLLLWARPFTKSEGELFRLYLVGFGVSRFFLEFVRWHAEPSWGLTPVQWCCLDLVLYGCLWVWLRHRKVVARGR